MTDEGSLQIRLEDLNIVLNAIAADEDEITVEHLSSTIGKLYTFDIGGPQDSMIQFEKSAEEYGQARSQIMGEQAQAEVPDKSSYVRSFTTSTLEFQNQSDIEDTISRYAGRDLREGHRRVYGVIDSNLIRWQLGNSLGIEPNGDGLQGSLLVTGIRDELQRYEGNEKIQSTTELEQELHPKYGRLFNQLKGQQREQRLGQEYYQYLDNQIYSEEIASDTGDTNILAACESFQKDTGHDLLYFSNDDNAIKMARQKNILGVRVDYPRSLGENVKVSWSDFAILLYVHAMLFGIIRLPKVDLYGVWTGDRGSAPGDILIEFRSQKTRHMVERDFSAIDVWRSERR